MSATQRKRVRAPNGGSNPYSRPYKKTKVMNPSVSVQAQTRNPHGVVMVKSEEIKYVDGYRNSSLVFALSRTSFDTWQGTVANPQNTSVAIGCMPVPKTGTNFSDRDGRKITMLKVRISGNIQWDQTSSTLPTDHSPVRIVIVKDTRTNGATLEGADVIGTGVAGDGVGVVSGTGGAFNLLTKPDGWGRYKILHDEVFDEPPMGITTFNDGTQQFIGSSNFKTFKITVKPMCEVNFNGTTGEVSSIIDNSIHMLAATVNGTGTPRLAYTARTSFIG